MVDVTSKGASDVSEVLSDRTSSMEMSENTFMSTLHDTIMAMSPR